MLQIQFMKIMLIVATFFAMQATAQTWPTADCPDSPYVKRGSDIIYHTCDCGVKPPNIVIGTVTLGTIKQGKDPIGFFLDDGTPSPLYKEALLDTIANRAYMNPYGRISANPLKRKKSWFQWAEYGPNNAWIKDISRKIWFYNEDDIEFYCNYCKKPASARHMETEIKAYHVDPTKKDKRVTFW